MTRLNDPRTIPDGSQYLTAGFETILQSLQAMRDPPTDVRRAAGPVATPSRRDLAASRAGAWPESVSSSFPAGPAPTCPPFASFSAAACFATADWLRRTEALLGFL